MSARDASWCRLRRVLCIPQVQQCTEKPLLFWLSKQLPRYRGFLLRVKSPKNRSSSRARPSNYDRHLSLKYKYKVRKPHFRRPAHVLARLRGSRCGATAPPLQALSLRLLGQREERTLSHPLPPPDAYRRPTALPRCARSGAAPALCCARLLAQGAGANWKGQRPSVARHGMGKRWQPPAR